MKERLLVFHAVGMDFKDKVGKPVQLTRVMYTDRRVLDSNEERGTRVSSVIGPLSLFKEFVGAPGFYDLDFAMKGKSLELVGAKFVELLPGSILASSSEYARAANGQVENLDLDTGEILPVKK